MEKFVNLHTKLAYCYSKIPYNKYLQLSDDEKDEICSRERNAAVEQMNSDAMNFENILKDRINLLKVEEERVTSKSYKPKEEVNVLEYI